MSYINSLVKLTKVNIDAKSIAATLIFTTKDSAERFYPLFVLIKVSSASSISLVPVASLGTNASSYNNIVTAITFTGLTSLNSMIKNDLGTSMISSVPPNTDIYMNITNGATATTMLIDVTLIGYYQ